MKFIIDAQLPKKLVFLFQECGFDAIHTLDLPSANKTKDREINDVSFFEKRIVVSKDSDFVDSLLVSDKPYKLLFIATGNISNKALIDLLRKNLEMIVQEFSSNRLIELTRDKLIVHE